jgi:NAD(P)-dependent dehydrogenase (short-subunit alcohol dehydrogenase family)
MARLSGKTALVTGGSRGIGRAIVLELAREGARVALNYQKSEEKAREVADEVASLGGSAFLVQANVGVAQEARAMVKRVADEFGRLDILVNNAGITRDTSLKKMTDEQWEDVIRTNLGGFFYCTSAAIPVMTEQKFGRIINISSMNGQIAAFGQANYSASKGGIIAFTKTVAREVARKGITLNSVCPGPTDTPLLAEVAGADERGQKIRAALVSAIPMKRVGQPEDIPGAVCFLASDDAAFITGQTISVSGGLTMHG